MFVLFYLFKVIIFDFSDSFGFEKGWFHINYLRSDHEDMKVERFLKDDGKTFAINIFLWFLD